MKVQIDEQELIVETINDLQDGLNELVQKRDLLDWEISKKQERLQAWEAKLGVLSGERPAAEPRKRAPRGANLKTILSLLQDPASPRQGLTTSEIVAKTHLSFSSVQVALKQGAETEVVEQVDNFWRPKLESKPDEGGSSGVAARNGNVT
jgi:response regulator of citrate/malate metabolism